jgi:hypothetical protein
MWKTTCWGTKKRSCKTEPDVEEERIELTEYMGQMNETLLEELHLLVQVRTAPLGSCVP